MCVLHIYSILIDVLIRMPTEPIILIIHLFIQFTINSLLYTSTAFWSWFNQLGALKTVCWLVNATIKQMNSLDRWSVNHNLRVHGDYLRQYTYSVWKKNVAVYNSDKAVNAHCAWAWLVHSCASLQWCVLFGMPHFQLLLLVFVARAAWHKNDDFEWILLTVAA